MEAFCSQATYGFFCGLEDGLKLAVPVYFPALGLLRALEKAL